MAIDYTADKLVDDVKALSILPDSQLLLDPEEILRMMNFQMRASLVPLIDSAAEEFFVHYEDIDYDSSVNEYGIPTRAVGTKLRDVVFVDSAGNEVAIPRLRPEQIKTGYQYGIGYNFGMYGFFLKDQSVVLFIGNPSGTSSYPTLRLKFFRRPSDCVSVNDCGQITLIDVNARQVTVDNAPPHWTDSLLFDFVKGTPHFTSKGDSLAIDSIAGNTITFTDALPDDLVVGDWVAEEGETPIPQVPYEAFPLLTQLTIIKTLEANRDSEGMKNAFATLTDMKTSFLQIITPRVDGSPVKLGGTDGISNYI